MVGPEETTCESLTEHGDPSSCVLPKSSACVASCLSHGPDGRLMSNWARTTASTTFGAVGTSTHGEMVTSAARTGEVCA